MVYVVSFAFWLYWPCAVLVLLWLLLYGATVVRVVMVVIVECWFSGVTVATGVVMVMAVTVVVVLLAVTGVVRCSWC